MQLTTHTDYSLRLLIYLAVRQEDMAATVQAAAERYGVSANHMAKVAQTLVQYGYVHSQRGRGGGLRLAQPSNRINIGTLVRRTENLRLLECFGPNSTCPIDPACRLKKILGRAQAAFLEVLDGYSLDTLVANEDELRALLGSASAPS
ncbi:Rrf2 family transcriptional regulator [Salinisphaera orenii MK-B5]|uniref:Rrf2 family transcriptional regulator n=1 Tax=Salinisphaera orenii MK-B5 TaxID=856730 RepID=A0A423PSZ7_9GAMM|nr:Rrf2 family transcriptional regulator [Salinisphaera orenii]ROO28713.1 Rrf2 family transcriptional regulator [Salinisphaera orenii MK-B5]